MARLPASTTVLNRKYAFKETLIRSGWGVLKSKVDMLRNRSIIENPCGLGGVLFLFLKIRLIVWLYIIKH